MSAATKNVRSGRLESFMPSQRVRVLVDERDRKVDAPGTVGRVCSDGGAWVALDERANDDVHPFPADDARGTHVKAYPQDCEAAIEPSGATGNRRTRKSKMWVEVAKVAADAELPPLTMAMFGRDHWSTFGYIETRIVDYRGVPDKRHLRCHHGRHPLQAHQGGCASAYPTRLRDGLTCHNHDDWDCLDDCEREGLLVNNGSAANPVFELTDLGRKIAAQLRAHKAAHGKWSTFEPEAT